MDDEPRPAVLLEAMARTLAEEVVPATEGSAQHSVRVVANLCRILARELASPGTAHDDASAAELLDRRLRESDADFDESILPVLLADVERRLAISKPSYLTEPS